MAMRIWETEQKGAHAKWEWVFIDYLRENGLSNTRGKSGARTIEQSLSIDAPGKNEDSSESYYLLDQESISRSDHEDQLLNQKDLYLGALEEFLSPLKLSRETLVWVAKSYKVKTN